MDGECRPRFRGLRGWARAVVDFERDEEAARQAAVDALSDAARARFVWGVIREPSDWSVS